MFDTCYFIKSFDLSSKEDIIFLISHMSKEIWRLGKLLLVRELKHLNMNVYLVFSSPTTWQNEALQLLTDVIILE